MEFTLMSRGKIGKNYLFVLLPLILNLSAFLSLTAVEGIKFEADKKSQSEDKLYKIFAKNRINIDLSFLPDQVSQFEFHVTCQSDENCPNLVIGQTPTQIKPSWREKGRIYWLLGREKISSNNSITISNPSEQEAILNHITVSNYVGSNFNFPRYLILLSSPGRSHLSILYLISIVFTAIAFQIPFLMIIYRNSNEVWRSWKFWVLLIAPGIFLASWFFLFLGGYYLAVSWETFLLLSFIGPWFLCIHALFQKFEIHLFIPASQRFKFLVFCFLFLVIISDRLKIIVDVLFHYADEDSALFWYGATEYAKGMFHEPRAFGQPYLTFIDSLFAVPLLWAGLPVDKALPLVSSLVALVPFGVMFYLALRTGNHLLAGLVLILPLALPIEYNIISSIQGRGTAYFILSLTLLSAGIAKGRTGYFFFGLFSVLAVSVCLDALLILLPVILYAIYKKGKEIHFIKWGGLGLILGFMIHILVQSFYRFYPEYILHGNPEDSVFFPNPGVGFSWPLLVKSISNLGMFWRYHVPVFPNQVWFLGGVFILLVFLLYHRKQYFLVGVSLLTGILFFYTLGMGKAYDGSESVFFSRARNYLGIPFFLGLLIYWISQTINGSNGRMEKIWIYLVLILFVFFTIIVKYQDYDAHLKTIFKTPGGLPGEYVSYIKEVSQAVEKAAKTYGAELVIFPDGNRTLTYGCGAMLNGKVDTLLAGYERRTWRIEEESNQLRGNLLIYGFDQRAAEEWERKTGKKARQVHQSPNLVLVESSPTLVLPFLHQINMPIRPTQLGRFYYRRGLLLERTANFSEAIADYSRAIDQKPDFGEAYYHRGLVYLACGENKKAIEDFSEALKRNPLDSKILFGRAMAYEKNNKYQDALSDLLDAKKKNHRDLNISNSLLRLKKTIE